MIKKYSPENFIKESLIEIIPRLLSQFNPMTDDIQYGQIIKMECLNIKITTELTYISVEILQPDIFNDYIPLEYIMQAMAPNISDMIYCPKKYPLFGLNKFIRKEIEYKIKTILYYCSPLLNCNENSLSRLKEWAIDFGGRIKLPDISDQLYLKNLKKIAINAFEKNNLWTAYEYYIIYKDYGGHMTLKDKWHMYLSSRAVFLLR